MEHKHGPLFVTLYFYRSLLLKFRRSFGSVSFFITENKNPNTDHLVCKKIGRICP